MMGWRWVLIRQGQMYDRWIAQHSNPSSSYSRVRISRSNEQLLPRLAIWP